MAEEVKTAAVGNQAGGNAENSGYVYQNRRYVGTKETVAYVVYDMSQSFNINTYSGRFVTNILQISLRFQRIANVINGIWDVINDVLFAHTVFGQRAGGYLEIHRISRADGRARGRRNIQSDSSEGYSGDDNAAPR